MGFSEQFEGLTGQKPLSWQRRLHDDYFEKVKGGAKFPPVIDLPTGLGKTMVMAIWLIARGNQAKPRINVPTRLIYVVDRRTVVDQATDLAEEFAYLLSENPAKRFAHVEKRKPQLADRRRAHETAFRELRAGLGQDLAISTLRGQLADNREWSRDPSRPAIIIGTVDLIGSSLLFSGYRSGFKTRPLHAGLLGQDSVLLLDEAHLSKPFEKLLGSITKFQETHTRQSSTGVPPVSLMRVVRMSATSSDAPAADIFKLNTDPTSKTFDLWSKLDENGNEENPIKTRFEARKRLTVTALGEKDDLNTKLKDAAIALACNDTLQGKRIVVFARKPDDANKIAKAIRDYTVESIDEVGKKTKTKPYEKDSVELLTGTMRGLERDELLEKPVLKRFLDGDEKPGDDDAPVFLISTSAGEVGFDLNADHMVCDATTIDSLIQRLGRVNRRGLGDAQVQLFVEAPKAKDGKPVELKGLDLAIANTVKLLTNLRDSSPEKSVDVSPKNIATLKQSVTWTAGYKDACSPEPTTVDLTDILLDNWSMTSITGPMPGRPEVAPWLRGIDDEQAQTKIVWRAELDLFKVDPDPRKALKAIFAKHPVRPHESLTANSYRVTEFLKQVTRPKGGRPDLLDTRVAIRLPRGEIVIRTIKQLIDDDGILNAEPTLILPATFGGLDKAGMLSHEAVPPVPKPDDPPPASLDVADHAGYEQLEDARARLRILIERTDDGWKPLPLPGGVEIPSDLKFDSSYEKSTQLFNVLKDADLRVRLVQPIKFDDEGDAVMSLVVLAPSVKGKKPVDQPLTQHVGAVERQAERIADTLKLIDPICSALAFAAKWHDEGKKADIWQYFIGYESGEPLGKGKSPRDPKSLKGYRHEFGSLLRTRHPDRYDTTSCTLPIDPDARDLALHLITTHHGMGRPHFENAIYAQFTDEERDAIHIESIRRFARLQKKYGHWRLAWLENLLRCADAIASAEAGSDSTEDEAEGGQS